MKYRDKSNFTNFEQLFFKDEERTFFSAHGKNIYTRIGFCISYLSNMTVVEVIFRSVLSSYFLKIIFIFLGLLEFLFFSINKEI